MDKIAFIGFGLVVVLAGMSTAQTSKAAPFALEIQAVKPSVEIGQPVLVAVMTKNISGTTIRIGQTNPGIEYDFEVRDAQGKAATEKPLLQQLKHTQYIFRNMSVVLNPGQSVTENFTLTEFFELAPPGPYSVQVLRQVPSSLGHGVVKSNRITIIMTAPQ